jgi:peptidoglycan/xylan/chitin deacetylase (PgdA/CDA1 family)
MKDAAKTPPAASAQAELSAPEREESSAAGDIPAEMSGVTSARLDAETSAPAREEESAPQREAAPVSGGVPASPLASEGDPYPGLYAHMEEKTDDNTKKIIYLTFDDGPSENTDKILDILDQCDVKAAFFVSAQYGTKEERAERLRSILDRGHTLALHSYTHNYEKIYASVDSFLDDLNRINEEVYAATGFQASLIRFPGGSSNPHNQSICEDLAAEVTRRGYTYHDWAVSCGDAEGKELSTKQVLDETVKECLKRKKSVVLFHDAPAQDTTVEALPGLIEKLRDEGYEFRQLDDSIRPFQFVKVN